jgi:hypothetical protein
VEQVAEDGHGVEVLDPLGQLAQVRAPVQGHLDAALACDRGLGHEQAGQRGVLDPRGGDPVDAVRALDRRDQPPRLVDLTEREQAVDRVQPVGVLVRLGAQRAHHQGQAVDLPARVLEQVGRADGDGGVVGQQRGEVDLARGPLARRGAVGVEHADHVVVLPQRHAQHRPVVLAHGQPAPRRADLALEHVLDAQRLARRRRDPRRPDAHLQRRRGVLEVLGVLLPQPAGAGQRQPVRGHPLAQDDRRRLSGYE